MQKIIVLLVLCLSLSACTVRTAYNYLDWYLAWQVDDYVELNDEQELAFEQGVKAFIEWHRENELPRYRNLLTRLKHAVEQGQVSEFKTVYMESESVWRESANYVAPNIILLLNKLSMSQRQELVSNIEKKQNEDHKKWRERANQSNAEKVENEIRELKETLGEITPEQQAEFKLSLKQMVNTREMRIAARQVWLEKMKRALLTDENIDQLAVYELLTDMSSYRTPEHLAASAANKQRYLTFLAKQLPKLTAKQVEHVGDGIEEYISDFSYLIAQK